MVFRGLIAGFIVISLQAGVCQAKGSVTWPDCRKAEASMGPSGDIYINGVRVGRNASGFRTNCVGDVAWISRDGNIYLNEEQLGSGVSLDYKIAPFAHVVAWSGAGGSMNKNRSRLGSGVSTFDIAPYTGTIAWKTAAGEIYKDSEWVGYNANSYSLSDYGVLAWSSADGNMYKDLERLGRNAGSFRISATSGDVVWLDTGFNLHRNSLRIAAGVNSFDLDQDGRILWTDMSGMSHTAE